MDSTGAVNAKRFVASIPWTWQAFRNSITPIGTARAWRYKLPWHAFNAWPLFSGLGGNLAYAEERKSRYIQC